jgi:hypothetical protein
MKTAPLKLQAKVWLYQADNPWHFVTIPPKQSSALKKEYVWPRRGFGAIPVQATIGKTAWKTSIFPDKNSSYLLPLKKEIRTEEKIKRGDTVTILLQVIT